MSAPDRASKDLVRCEDMRIHAERAISFLGRRTFEEFCEDALIQAAVIRCIEVVGEAARFVSVETRAGEPNIPWSMIVGMRHVLAHDYGTVALDKVHDVVTRHLPDLLDGLSSLIPRLEREAGWPGGGGD